MATILMVAIAIAAAVVAYSWFSSVQANLQSQAGEQAESLSNVRFEIVSAECNGTAYLVYVHNLSDTALNETATVIAKSSDGTVEDTGTVNLDVGADSVAAYNISLANSSCASGKTIELRVGTFVASAKVK